jgi:succinate dehydrogenase cytochrome b556 subunit
MKKRIRPLSPHLTIYKPQATSLLSIFHRVAGSLLGFILIVIFLAFNLNVLFIGSSFQYCFYFDLFTGAPGGGLGRTFLKFKRPVALLVG